MYLYLSLRHMLYFVFNVEEIPRKCKFVISRQLNMKKFKGFKYFSAQ